MGKKRFWCGSIGHLLINTRDFPVWLSYQKAKILALEIGLSQFEAKKEGEVVAVEEEEKCLASEAAVEDAESVEGEEEGTLVTDWSRMGWIWTKIWFSQRNSILG